MIRRKERIGAYDFEGREKEAHEMYEKGEIDYQTYEMILGEIASDQQDYNLHGPVEIGSSEYC